MKIDVDVGNKQWRIYIRFEHRICFIKRKLDKTFSRDNLRLALDSIRGRHSVLINCGHKPRMDFNLPTVTTK